MKNKIKIFTNALIILVVLGLVLFFALKDNYREIISLIKSISIIWIVISMLLLFLYRFLIGSSMYLLVRNGKEKISLLRTFQISFIILFFHGVTPFSTGGQPMEVYYLHNEKVPIEKATNIVLQNFMLYQTALILVGIFTIGYNYMFNIFPFNNFMRNLVMLGFFINFAVWLFTFIVAFGKKSGVKLINICTNIIYKLKIIKDKEKWLNRVMDYANKFYDSAISLKNNKKVIFKALLINVLALLVLYSIPFVLIYGFKGIDLGLFDVIVATSYVMIIGSFVPIPGGTGGIEYSFVYFFGYLLSGSVVPALMLIWRFITYYMGMIIGAIFLVFYRKKSGYVEEEKANS